MAAKAAEGRTPGTAKGAAGESAAGTAFGRGGDGRALLVPAQGELHGLVLPTLLVEIQQRGKHALRGMREAHLAGGGAGGMVQAPT